MAFDACSRTPVFDECAQLRLCRLEGDVLFQSPNDVQNMSLALLNQTWMQPERQPNLRVVIHDISPWRHNANDFVWTPLDFYFLSNQRPSAECRLPQFVRENGDRRR